MALTGRTVSKYTRVYAGDTTHGVGLCADVSSIPSLGTEFDYNPIAAYCWGVNGGMLDQGAHPFGPVNGVFSSDTTVGSEDIHEQLKAMVGGNVAVAVALGIREEATCGSPCYVWQGLLNRYEAVMDAGNMVTFTSTWAEGAQTRTNYGKAWGHVIHPLGAETAANTNTTNVIDNGVASAAGGYLYYCLTAIDAGTVTISVDDSADGSTYGALSGATSGALSAIGAGVVQLGTTAAVKRYIRFQVALAGGASTATFFAAFVRG